MTPVALTIAGSDPSGGAGIQADLKTFHQLRVYGTSAVTLVTVQNSRGVSRVDVLDPDLVGEQIDSVLDDLRPMAVKTGALGNAEVIEAVAKRLFNCPLVVDPVMVSSSGRELIDAAGRRAIEKLFAQAALVTPNLDEAAALAGIEVNTVEEMREAARRIARICAGSVVVKGGHLAGAGEVVDVLLHEGEFTEFRGARIDTRHTHGTGCTYSAAITASLAKGMELPAAIEKAWQFVQDAIAGAPGLGSGAGPLNHWV